MKSYGPAALAAVGMTNLSAPTSARGTMGELGSGAKAIAIPNLHIELPEFDLKTQP